MKYLTLHKFDIQPTPDGRGGVNQVFAHGGEWDVRPDLIESYESVREVSTGLGQPFTPAFTKVWIRGRKDFHRVRESVQWIRDALDCWNRTGEFTEDESAY